MSIVYDIYPAVMRVIDLISEGRTVTAACDEASLNINTFKNYIKNNPSLQEHYEEAWQRGADAMADALVNIFEDKTYGETDPKAAKVISDNIKWRLERTHSKKYGQKVEVAHTITADRAIIDALNAGRNRAARLQFDGEQDVIDVQAIPMTEEEQIAQMSGLPIG